MTKRFLWKQNFEWQHWKPFMKPSLPFFSKGFQSACLLVLCFLAAPFPSEDTFFYKNIFWKVSIPYFCYYTLGFFGNITCGIVSSLYGRNKTYMIALSAVLLGSLFLLGELPFTLKLLPLHAVAFSFIGMGNVAAGCCITPTVLENVQDGPKDEQLFHFILTTRVSEYIGFGLASTFGGFLYLFLGETYRNWIIFLLQCLACGLCVFTIYSVSETRESNLFITSMTSQKLDFFSLMKYLWSSFQQNRSFILLLCSTLLFLTCNSVSLWFMLLAENWSWMISSGRLVFYAIWIVFAISRAFMCYFIPELMNNKLGYHRLFLYSCGIIAAVECLEFFHFGESFLLPLSYTLLAPIVCILVELFLAHIVPSRIRSTWIGIVRSMENIGAFTVMIPILVLLRPNKNLVFHVDLVRNMRSVFSVLWLLLVGFWFILSIPMSPNTSLRSVDEQYSSSLKTD